MGCKTSVTAVFCSRCPIRACAWPEERSFASNAPNTPGLFVLFNAAAVVSDIEVPMHRIAQLMSAVAEMPGITREHIGTVLCSLMDGIFT